MKSIFKILSLSLCGAALASSLLISTAAAQVEVESSPVSVTFSSNTMQKFAPTAGGTAVECTTVHNDTTDWFGGWVYEHTTPTYFGCENFLGAATSFSTNGCGYWYNLAKGSTKGTTDIECPAGKSMEIKVGSICTYTIGTQTGLGSVSFSNVGSGSTREIALSTNVTGLTSTRTTNDFFCPAAGSTGTFTGNLTMTGESAGGNHIGIFVD
jgi:hypothetical protein